MELYNLREDVGEERDLAGMEPQLVAELQEKLADWRQTVEAKIPERNPNYVPWDESIE